MSDETPKHPAAMPNDEAGEPIRTLGELEQDTSPFFLRNIRRRIYRRTAASQLLAMSLELPQIVFIELARMFVQVLNASSTRKGD